MQPQKEEIIPKTFSEKHVKKRQPGAHLCLRHPGLLGQASAGSSHMLRKHKQPLSCDWSER
jgi:hypothetical protein